MADILFWHKIHRHKVFGGIRETTLAETAINAFAKQGAVVRLLSALFISIRIREDRPGAPIK
jgi:hypothetical protein